MANSPLFKAYFKGRYRILITERDADLVESVVSNLNHGIRRIEELFNTNVEILFINVFICPSRSIFDQFVKVITAVPTDPGRIGQPQGHDLYILSPRNYRSDAPYYGRDEPPYYDIGDFRRILVHELVHLWEELSSPRGAMDLGDAWFSEGMAMYVSEWYREPREKRRLEEDYARRIIPRPEELTGERNYTWGCVLFEFLLREVGAKRLLDMVSETNHKNIIELLGLERERFWERYLDFVRSRLDSPAQ